MTGRASGGEEDEEGEQEGQGRVATFRPRRERLPPQEYWKVGGAATTPLSAKAAGKRPSKRRMEPQQAPPVNNQTMQADSLAKQCVKPAKQRRVQPISVPAPGEAGPSSSCQTDPTTTTSSSSLDASGSVLCPECNERPIDPRPCFIGMCPRCRSYLRKMKKSRSSLQH